MALLGLLFSKFYEEYLQDGKKGTIIVGETTLPEGSELFVFLSEGNSVEESNSMNKIGTAKNITINRMPVSSLNQDNATLLGYGSVEEVKEALKKWHGIEDENAPISFVTFDFFKI